MIELKGVCFGYGREPLLENLSCRLPDHAITAVIGPNGSGKSTALRLCARLLTPQRGEIRVGGKPAAAYDPRSFARQLAYLPQSRPTPMITVRSLVSHGRFPHLGMTRRLSAADEAAVDRALTMTGMAACAHRDLRTLSGGQRQKAYLAMLIAQGAPHLLLDEPTTYLDVLHQMELMEILRALRDEGCCIGVVLHDLTQAVSLCDRALLLHEGRLLFDGPAEALYDSGTIETAFGVRPVRRQGVSFERL